MSDKKIFTGGYTGYTFIDEFPLISSSVDYPSMKAAVLKGFHLSTLKGAVDLLTPKKVIYNRKERTTVVIWEDNSKTISKAGETEEWSEEMGYAACLMKKLYGSRSGYTKMLEKVSYRELSKEEKKERALERKERSLENIKKNEIQVIVTRSKYDSTWYADCIGEMFNVVGYDEDNWMVTDMVDDGYEDFKDQGYVIRRSDCKKVK
jgi:hypothetical protein